MCVIMNPQFKLIQLEPARAPSNVIPFIIKLGDFERLRSALNYLEISICEYSVYCEDELR
jgi:hypothetical protein